MARLVSVDILANQASDVTGYIVALQMGISQEELLSLMIQAVAKGKVKFATKTVYEVK